MIKISKIVKNLIRKLLPIIYCINRLIWLISRSNHGYLRILIYHHIPDNRMEIFKKQMVYLQRKYNVVDFVEAKKMLENKSRIIGANILVTFDDGFYSNYIAAKEILEPLGIKAIFFVVTNFIRDYDQEQLVLNLKNILGKNDYSQKREFFPMSWQELKELKDAGHTIGSHTASHLDCSNISLDEDINYQLKISKEVLEEHLQCSIECFAFPFGSIQSFNCKLLNDALANYNYVFTGIRGNNNKESRVIWRDVVTLCSDSNVDIRFIIEGGLSMFYLKPRWMVKKMLEV